MFPMVVTTAFLLGIRHALDPDHLVTVSTLTAEERRLRSAARLGVLWGLGHLLTLALLGIPAIVLRLALPSTLESSMAVGVGTLLVVLGGASLVRLRRERVHFHLHTHDNSVHVHAHFHGHRQRGDHEHGHPAARGRRAVLTFGIGCVHGLAGSGLAVLLALSAAPSAGAGVAYLLVFGMGTVLGMLAATMLIATPTLITAQSFGVVHLGLRVLAGLGSILLGAWMLADRLVVWLA